jgi:hypothetical protein
MSTRAVGWLFALVLVSMPTMDVWAEGRLAARRSERNI